MLTHLSLFSGIGGLDIAAEAAGFQTVGQCEWADYPTKVLEKHWPDVPRWRDIRALTGGDFFAKTGYPQVDIISGGFPCQPFSVAGKRRGTDDDRYLWPEMLRVISELRPTWVLGENVPGIVNLALDQVLADLEVQGYACQTFNIPACGVDAPHRRARICIIAYSNRYGRDTWRPKPAGQPRASGIASGGDDVANTSIEGNRSLSIRTRGSQQANFDADGSRSNVANTNEPGLQRQHEYSAPIKAGTIEANARSAGGGNDVSDADPQQWNGCRRTRDGWPESANGGWWPVEPDVGRVAHGIPSRVDRLKCLGNAVVPQQFYPFFKFIADIERGAPIEHT